MAPKVAEVLESAKSLRRDEIADLAYQLLRVLDEGTAEVHQPRVDAAWRVEIRRRIDDIESGNAQLVSHEETVSLARAMLASRESHAGQPPADPQGKQPVAWRVPVPEQK